MDKNKLKQLIREMVIQEIKVNPNTSQDFYRAIFDKKMNQIGVDPSSIEVEGLTTSWRGVDLSEVFIAYAKWNNGTELTDEELEQLNYVDEFITLAQEKAIEDYYL
jgi:hypothetical protein